MAGVLFLDQTQIQQFDNVSSLCGNILYLYVGSS